MLDWRVWKIKNRVIEISNTELMSELKEKLQKLLQQFEDSEIEDVDDGICNNANLTEEEIVQCQELWSNWEFFSGWKWINFPVPDPKGEISPKQIYLNTNDVWTGRYGELRVNLLEYLINNL